MAGTLNIDFDRIKEDMESLKPRIVLLQLPSGLKRKAEKVAEALEKRYGCEALISGDSCYGACDVPVASMKLVDAIIQVGHSPMPSIRCSKPVLFLPVDISINLRKMIHSAKPLLVSPVGLLVTSQHIDQLKESKALLEKEGFKVKVGRGSRRLASPGLVLGCDYSSAHAISDSVSSYLLIGGGRFHAIGLKLSTKKPVVIVDPERSTPVAEDVDIESFERKRYATVFAISKAESIGVIVSSKPGQERLGLGKRLLDEIRDSRKKGSIVVMDEVSPDALKDLGFDAYVSTACPRIALDDSERFEMPVGTPMELMIALHKVKWEKYSIDEWGSDSVALGED